jgi:hypothetical protein
LEEQSRHFLLYAENPIRTYAYAREPTTCIPLLYYAILPESFTKNLAKPVQFRFYCKYNPFTPNDYFPLAISPNITRLLHLFSYTSLSGITTKTHFTPDFTKETPEKSRIDTLLRARAHLLYDLLSSLLIRQNKTHLTSNSTPC